MKKTESRHSTQSEEHDKDVNNNAHNKDVNNNAHVVELIVVTFVNPIRHGLKEFW